MMIVFLFFVPGKIMILYMNNIQQKRPVPEDSFNGSARREQEKKKVYNVFLCKIFQSTLHFTCYHLPPACLRRLWIFPLYLIFPESGVEKPAIYGR
jgi:hypothetical protein